MTNLLYVDEFKAKASAKSRGETALAEINELLKGIEIIKTERDDALKAKE